MVPHIFLRAILYCIISLSQFILYPVGWVQNVHFSRYFYQNWQSYSVSMAKKKPIPIRMKCQSPKHCFLFNLSIQSHRFRSFILLWDSFFGSVGTDGLSWRLTLMAYWRVWRSANWSNQSDRTVARWKTHVYCITLWYTRAFKDELFNTKKKMSFLLSLFYSPFFL